MKSVLNLRPAAFIICWFVLVRAAWGGPPPAALPAATEARVRAALAKPEVATGHVGLVVIALGTAAGPHAYPALPYTGNTQPVLLEIDGGKRFMPASNLKLYTAALALRQLGAEHRFATRVLARGAGKASYVAELRLVGGGDPALTTADLDALAAAIAARGVRRYGSLAVDNTWFKAETFGGRYPDGWTLDDTIWYYGPEISALAINRNQVDLVIEGAGRAGLPASVVMAPVCRQIEVEAHVRTVADGQATEPLHYEREDSADGLGCRLVVTGALAVGTHATEGIAVPHPALWAADLLRAALARHGVVAVTGPAPSGASREVARRDSAPLGVLLRRLLKNSDNLYAEMLLRAAVRAAGAPPADNAARQAHAALTAWLREEGIDTGSLRFEDGSGLSRYNLVTPLVTARLLAAVERLPGSEVYWDALPIAGQDGTLKGRMGSSAAAGNARAKTGTFSIASTLSGYVTTRDGHRLAVALMTNFVPTDAARALQDDIYALLADSALNVDAGEAHDQR